MFCSSESLTTTFIFIYEDRHRTNTRTNSACENGVSMDDGGAVNRPHFDRGLCSSFNNIFRSLSKKNQPHVRSPHTNRIPKSFFPHSKPLRLLLNQKYDQFISLQHFILFFSRHVEATAVFEDPNSLKQVNQRCKYMHIYDISALASIYIFQESQEEVSLKFLRIVYRCFVVRSCPEIEKRFF